MGLRELLVALTFLWLMVHRMEGKMTCREVQLHRDCEKLCSTGRDGVVSCELRVAVLLPADPRFDISLPKVLPVLGKAASHESGTGRVGFAVLPRRIARNSIFV